MRPLMIALGVALIGACWSSQSGADDVRHPNVPEPLRGTWAPGTGLCAQQQKTVTLSEKRYTDAQRDCEVSWVQEKAGTPGTIYSAHMLCRTTPNAAGAPKPTNLLLWLRESGRVSIGPAFDALVVNERCP
jgi:hypothetical protein